MEGITEAPSLLKESCRARGKNISGQAWRSVNKNEGDEVILHLFLAPTLPETNSLHLKMETMYGWNTSFLSAWPLFSGANC